ncbi:MAG: hypothetical protein AMXMBFR61_24270 [Fimbriimonadales bacterium]
MKVRLLLASLFVAMVALALGQDASDPHGIAPIMRANDEVNLLTDLTPLKLTKEQYPKVIALLKASREKFDKELKALEAKEAASVKQLKPKVDEAHAKALKGEVPPDSYFEEWQKMLMSHAVDRANLRISTVRSLGDELKKVLTEEQVKSAIASAKKVITKAQGGKEPDPTKYGDNSLFWYYVENVLMNDLVPALLEKLSKPSE